MRASRRGTRLHTLRMTAVPKGAYTVLCGSCTGHVCRSGRCHRATAAHIRHACSCRASLPRRAVRGSRRWMRPVWASPRRYRSNGSQMCLTTGPCGMWWSKRRWYARHAHRRHAVVAARLGPRCTLAERVRLVRGRARWPKPAACAQHCADAGRCACAARASSVCCERIRLGRSCCAPMDRGAGGVRR